MTEQEWLACSDPQKMLEYLHDKASERKLRLFACACCRRLWHCLRAPSRRAVEVAEQYADGLASSAELRRVNRAGEVVFHATRPSFPYEAAYASRTALDI